MQRRLGVSTAFERFRTEFSGSERKTIPNFRKSPEVLVNLTIVNVRGLTISLRTLTVDRHSAHTDIHLKDEGGVKEFSAWTGDVLPFVAFLCLLDKCSSCIFHLCAVLSKGESIQTTCTVFLGNVFADQRLRDQLS